MAKTAEVSESKSIQSEAGYITRAVRSARSYVQEHKRDVGCGVRRVQYSVMTAHGT